jgi:glycosyltransferase involved in cell wall biosynthesis
VGTKSLRDASIDIIIPFHQVNEFLEDSVASILNSQKINARIILVDDRKIKNLPIDFQNPRIKILETEGGQGYRRSLLLGVANSTSEYLGFQDSDDISHPMRLYEQLELLIEEKVDITSCLIAKMNKNLTKRMIGRFNHLIPDQDYVLPLLLGSVQANSTWIMRQEVAKDPLYLMGEETSADWATAFQIFKKYRIKALEKEYYFYRQHDEQMTKSLGYQKESFLEIYKLWSTCNRGYNLPRLSETEAQFVADPWNTGIFNSTVEKWIIEFLRINQKIDSRNMSYYKAIFGFRCVKHIFRSRRLPSLRLALLTLRMSPYCILFFLNNETSSRKIN